MKVHDRASTAERAFCVFSVSSLFCTLLLTKAILFLFYSCFCYNKSRKEDERRTETDIELNRSSNSNNSNSIIDCPAFIRLVSSNNISSHNIAPATNWSNNHKQQHQQQCDHTNISFPPILPHKPDQQD
jgi:hypothetical protein